MVNGIEDAIKLAMYHLGTYNLDLHLRFGYRYIFIY